MNYRLRRYELLNSKLFNMNYALRAYDIYCETLIEMALIVSDDQ